MEDYLERILELINVKGYARVVDIAAALKISQASVTNMVQRLDGEGLLKYEKYRGLVLTTAGETLARNIARRHELLTDFLTLLGLDDRVIYHDVEGMEHHISPSTLRAIADNCDGVRRSVPSWRGRSSSSPRSLLANACFLRRGRIRRTVVQLLKVKLLHAAVVGL
ncbi:MAG: transcriptional regulator MntR [Verrucomicrobia bacterium]|nr:MAG: transcriptional regulator MntR [Verrucomicrobiota bacterium]